MIVYEGWIHAPESDRKKLENLGIKLGGYSNGRFHVIECPEEAVEELTKMVQFPEWFYGLSISREDI